MVETAEAPGVGRRHLAVMWPLATFSALTLAILPFADLPGPFIPAITPVFATLVFSSEIATAVLLLILFSEHAMRSVLLLACAYLYSAAMTLPHLLTFPGAVFEGVVVGTPQSTGWVFISWQLGFALLALLAVLVRIRESSDGKHRVVQIRAGVAVVITLAGVFAVLIISTVFVDRLPPMMGGDRWSSLNTAANVAIVGALATGVGLILIRVDRSDRLFRWLALALLTLAFANLLSVLGGGRYTVGWLIGRLSWVVSASVLFCFFLGLFARQHRDLAEARNRLEALVQERTTALRSMVAERDTLLSEVYHRVNNNLQTMSTLLLMERRRLPASEEGRVLERMARRARAMGLVHQQIMGSGHVDNVEMRAFLVALAGGLDDSLALGDRDISLEVRAHEMSLDIDTTMSIGLIVNELVSNAAEHAFGDGGPGQIRVILEPADADLLTLEISDEGGKAAGAAAPVPGFGTRVVMSLVQQLGGTVETFTEAGMRHRVVFPQRKSVQA